MAKTYNKENIDFLNVLEPTTITTVSIGSERKFNGNVLQDTTPIIGALDINWEGAQINNKTINTTAQLLAEISSNTSRIEHIVEVVDNGGGGSGGGNINPDSPAFITILSAIRSLQAEVLKIQNTFRYGINSYTGTEFAMSSVVESHHDVEENEPLWATDETELSFIDGLDFSDETAIQNFFKSSENSIVENKYIKYNYNDTIIWEDTEGFLKTINDAKQYTYISASSRVIQFELKDDNENSIHIDLFNIIRKYKPLDIEQAKYNILLIVSKQIPIKTSIDGNNQYGGKNFIWLSVSEFKTGSDIINGYINSNGELVENEEDTPIYFDTIYYLNEITFSSEHNEGSEYIYKLDFYSKYQDFSYTVEGATPTDIEDYKYRTAALTIRSMETKAKLDEHVNQYQNNELIWCEENKRLFIYTNNKLINIGTGGGTSPIPTEEDIMTSQEILKALVEQGLINITFRDSSYTSEEELYSIDNIIDYSFNDISAIKFINGETGKKFNVTIDPYGKLVSEEESNVSLASLLRIGTETSILKTLYPDFESDRAFVAQVNHNLYNTDITKDMKLKADRIQIGAIYAPLNTDTIFGCSHGYIELVNTSDKDFYLDGCYMHYSSTPDYTITNNIKYSKLALKGYIPKGGTYLIRCKKYSTNDNDSNLYIHVDSYDQEWYDNGELLDLTMNSNGSYGFMLTYGDTLFDDNGNPTSLITPMTQMVKKYDGGNHAGFSGGIIDSASLYRKNFIDALYIGKLPGNNTSEMWATWDCKFTISSNSIYKITFELDPAKQAFCSSSTKDSSRVKWQKAANDYQVVSLVNKYIEFPKSDERKPVSDYTPKASFEGKNVITDKSSLNKEKPNCISVGFGINPYTTRTFNWVSSGLYDEAVVIIKDDHEYIFESYKYVSEVNTQKDFVNGIRRKEYSLNINNIIYCNNDSINKHLCGKFPGNNEQYTSHKCILEFEEVNEPVKYEYYICRLNKFGQLDKTYKSEVRSFTLYPQAYQPKLYQVTDQQGFHWIEYQVWAAAAKDLQKLIHEECDGKEIMPMIVNTGDCTQSGARVNEWVDYFNAGEYLFKEFEQLNIVGNNDLCDTNINILGTGDDVGKSNGYFFYIFNCNEVTDENLIINGKYVPSTYYVDTKTTNNQTCRLLFINSEITTTNCRDWFNLKDGDNIINIYTGLTYNPNATIEQTYAAAGLFKPIYETLYDWTNNQANSYIALCHEMPYTVVTNKCLNWNSSNNEYSKFRSLSDANKLIGSHTNQIDEKEHNVSGGNPKGMHWLSRLLEYRGIKLCIGGHKHTYAATYPVRENYIYVENGETKYSLYNGPMTMPPSLKDDTATWKLNVYYDELVDPITINLSKFPIVNRVINGNDIHKSLDSAVIKHLYLDPEKTNEFMIIKLFDQADTSNNDVTMTCFLPFVDEGETQRNNVLYLMCQATGYKLTSNKELPSICQKFSMLIPHTDLKGGADSPSADQKQPMFGIIDILNDNHYNLKIGRLMNILGTSSGFTQSNYGTKQTSIEYIVLSNHYIYGIWTKNDNGIIKQTTKKDILYYQDNGGTYIITTSLSNGEINNEQITNVFAKDVNPVLIPEWVKDGDNVYQYLYKL